MPRPRLLLPTALLLLAPLALTGCGSEHAGSENPDSGNAGSEHAGSGAGPTPSRADLEDRARAAQTRTAHVYVTEADGFTLAEQSVGVLGDDGFQAVYVAKEGGAQIKVGVERGTVDGKTCRSVHPPAGRCEKDGKGWYRTPGSADSSGSAGSSGASGSTGSWHAYARSEHGLRVQLSADPRLVDRDTLRAAAEQAHRADAAELDAVLPKKTSPATPVERGDIPRDGDGAPQDPPGAGG
ncbi:hypothetical protein [Streptomyces flavofungini]|uniref:Lipoprotein n=1 Tax=Streptomyces flavofungini TaxID=68200 RepID=A0ABS0XFY8_9ACTN|nr:hypothetical protein [Streptomyces flavofungini]MBJ3812140.1 hypothetical protein [Streptomyces flavofungini]GHC47588.1 membrane protein [Streptomyces flavofungini]